MLLGAIGFVSWWTHCKGFFLFMSIQVLIILELERMRGKRKAPWRSPWYGNVLMEKQRCSSCLLFTRRHTRVHRHTSLLPFLARPLTRAHTLLPFPARPVGLAAAASLSTCTVSLCVRFSFCYLLKMCAETQLGLVELCRGCAGSRVFENLPLLLEDFSCLKVK